MGTEFGIKNVYKMWINMLNCGKLCGKLIDLSTKFMKLLTEKEKLSTNNPQ